MTESPLESPDPGPSARVPSAANIHFCDITAAEIRLRAAVTGRLLLDINQGTFLQI